MGKFIIKYRYIFLILFVALILLAGFLFPEMIGKVNYDLTSYLPEGYATYDGFQFLSKNFNIHGDIEIGINATYDDASKVVELISADDGVSGCTWAGMLSFIPGVSGKIEGFDINGDPKSYEIKDSKTFTDTWNTMTNIDYDIFEKLANEDPTISNIEEKNNKYTWALLVTLKFPPSDPKSIEIFRNMKANILNPIIGEDNYASAGMTDQATALFDTVFDEIAKYAIASGIVVLIILLLTTNSLTEPFVLIVTMLSSILINLGTNAFFPSTSIITFACSAILQLGLSMDYAIFLLHQYRYELTLTIDPKQALANAIPKSAKAIFASALTTVSGLLALLVMKFGVGADLGLVIAKGILCSFLTVLFLQPCLMLMVEKGRTKTAHKCLDFKYKHAVKRSVRDRKWVGAVFALLLIPIAYGAQTLQYKYIKFLPDPVYETEVMKQLGVEAQKLGNQVVIVAPIKGQQNYEFFDKLETEFTNGEISYKLGLHVMFPEYATYTYIDENGKEQSCFIKTDGQILLDDNYKPVTPYEFYKNKELYEKQVQKNYLNLPLDKLYPAIEPHIDKLITMVQTCTDEEYKTLKATIKEIVTDLNLNINDSAINSMIDGIRNNNSTEIGILKGAIKGAFEKQYTINDVLGLFPVFDKINININDAFITITNFINNSDIDDIEKAQINTIHQMLITHYTNIDPETNESVLEDVDLISVVNYINSIKDELDAQGIKDDAILRGSIAFTLYGNKITAEEQAPILEKVNSQIDSIKTFLVNRYTKDGVLQKASIMDVFYALISEDAHAANLPIPKELSMVGSFIARVENANAPGTYTYYTMYTAGIDPSIDNEGIESRNILKRIQTIAANCFGDDACYITGLTQTAADFAEITPNDFMWVSIISVLAIFIILIPTLRSIKFPILLVLLIESGIWINLLMQYIFAQGTINFMSFLFITAVQLGATVDYAILVATKYRENRKRFEPQQAAYLAATSSAMSITTSALIMAGACMSVYAIATNLIIKEMTFLMSRGSIISAILVIFVLPALLPLIDSLHGNEIHFQSTPKIRKFKKKFKKPTNTKPIGLNGEITLDKQDFTGPEIAAMMASGLDINQMSNKEMKKWVKKNM